MVIVWLLEYLGTARPRLQLMRQSPVCGGSRKKPQTVANERPAASEKVQFGEKTHLYSYIGHGV
jgi:hypothetical protein